MKGLASVEGGAGHASMGGGMGHASMGRGTGHAGVGRGMEHAGTGGGKGSGMGPDGKGAPPAKGSITGGANVGGLYGKGLVLRPLGRQDNEDLDRLIVAADTGLLWLTCLLFDSEWFWDSLIDSWTDYLMSPFEDYPLNLDAQ